MTEVRCPKCGVPGTLHEYQAIRTGKKAKHVAQVTHAQLKLTHTNGETVRLIVPATEAEDGRVSVPLPAMDCGSVMAGPIRICLLNRFELERTKERED